MESWSFWLGATLVVWWAYRDFQSPYAVGYVRDRTDRQRYALSAIVFVLGAWMAYVLVWILAKRIRYDFDLSEKVVGFSAVIVTVIVLPKLPLISAIVARFRGLAQELAGFPQDVENLLSSLRRPVTGGCGAVQNFNEGIHQFGLSLAQLKMDFSLSCVASALEAQRMHDQLAQCLRGQINLVEPGFLGHYRGRYRVARLCRYLDRRCEAIARLDSEYFQLLHRAARTVKLANDRPLSARQLKQLSAFLADQAENLIARYQKLIAQTALAVFPPEAPRLRFLENLGYAVSGSTPSLPLWPIAAVLAIDVLTSGIGFVIVTYISSGIGVDLRSSAAVIFAHGFGMTAAVFWAIAPKVMWAWARPSLIARPIASYAVFGLASYACAVIFFVASLSGFGAPSPESGQGYSLPVSAILLLAPGLFAITSIVLSWRIDHRIITSSHGHGRHAARDALSLIAATILFSLFFRTMAHFAFGMPWIALPPVWLIWPVVGITALVIGFSIPGWAVRYIYPCGGDPDGESANRSESLDRTLTGYGAHDAKLRA